MPRRSVALPTLLIAAVLSGTGALAVTPQERLADPALESRAREISAGLRCLVCQNQSIDDSEAPLARDLRVLVRDRLKAGDTNQQVNDFVVARYGEYVLLRPPFGWRTALLWAGPFLVFAAGLLGLLALRRRHAEASLGEALSEAEKAELEKVLGKGSS
jgi:cytochrome c-type biogenesis protein CcmH